MRPGQVGRPFGVAPDGDGSGGSAGSPSSAGLAPAPTSHRWVGGVGTAGPLPYLAEEGAAALLPPPPLPPPTLPPPLPQAPQMRHTPSSSMTSATPSSSAPRYDYSARHSTASATSNASATSYTSVGTPGGGGAIQHADFGPSGHRTYPPPPPPHLHQHYHPHPSGSSHPDLSPSNHPAPAPGQSAGAGAHAQPNAPSPSGDTLARPYRSRKDRPCDMCRLRKGRCIIEEVGKPCQSCAASGKACTFDIRPTPRTRPPKPDPHGASPVASPPDEGQPRSIGGPVELLDQQRGRSLSTSGPVGRRRTSSAADMSISNTPSSLGTARFAPYLASPRNHHAHPRPGSVALRPDPAQDVPLSPTTVAETKPSGGSGFLGFSSANQRPSSLGHSSVPPAHAQPSRGGFIQDPTSSRLASSPVLGGVDRRPSRAAPVASPKRASKREPEGSPPPPPRGRPSLAAAPEGEPSQLLYNFIVEMIQGGGGGGSSEAAGPAGGTDVVPRAAAGDQSRTPFVIGSSCSEDPVLLTQTKRSSERNAAPAKHRNERGHVGASAEGAKRRAGGGDGAARIALTSRARTSSGGGSAAASEAEGDASAVHETEDEAIHRYGNLSVRQVTQNPLRPIFFAYFEGNPYGVGKRIGAQIGAKEYADVRKRLHDRAGPLMVLYAQRDSAVFPVLTTSQRRILRLAAASTIAKDESQQNVSRKGLVQQHAFDAVASARVEVSLPPALAHAILASAMVYDESLRPLCRQAWGSSLSVLHDLFDFSSLLTLQTAILDLSGRPSINQFGNSMTLCRTISMAYNLGLNMSPISWRMPAEERDLRIRLWAALLVHDTLSALCWGRPMMIHGGSDHNVPLPTRNRFSPCCQHLEDAEEDIPFSTGVELQQPASQETGTSSRGSGIGGFGPARRERPTHHSSSQTSYASTGGGSLDAPSRHTPGDTFAALVTLCAIVSDILLEFHAVRRPAHDSNTVPVRVQAFLLRIEDWREHLPWTLAKVLKANDMASPSLRAIPGTRSLQLTYHGVMISLCRTTLDASATDSDENRVLNARLAALQACQMLVLWIESLTVEDYGGWWLHYGAHHLAACQVLLARLALGFSRAGDDARRVQTVDVLQRFLTGLSDSRRFHRWDLSELALARAEPYLSLLQSRVPGFPNMGHLLQVQAAPAMPFDGPSADKGANQGAGHPGGGVGVGGANGRAWGPALHLSAAGGGGGGCPAGSTDAFLASGAGDGGAGPGVTGGGAGISIETFGLPGMEGGMTAPSAWLHGAYLGPLAGLGSVDVDMGDVGQGGAEGVDMPAGQHSAQGGGGGGGSGSGTAFGAPTSAGALPGGGDGGGRAGHEADATTATASASAATSSTTVGAVAPTSLGGGGGGAASSTTTANAFDHSAFTTEGLLMATPSGGQQLLPDMDWMALGVAFPGNDFGVGGAGVGMGVGVGGVGTTGGAGVGVSAGGSGGR